MVTLLRFGKIEDKEWYRKAACEGMYHLFDQDEEGNYVDSDRAVSICETCPVQRECAIVGRKEPQGIWGGFVH